MDKESHFFQLNIDSNYLSPVSWVLDVFGQYTNTKIELNQTVPNQVDSIGFEQDNSLCLSVRFWKNMQEGAYNWVDNLEGDLTVRNEHDEIDYLATAFYFINCIWERGTDQKLDAWGRSQFKDSVWKMNGYNEPFSHVNTIFDSLCAKLNIDKPKNKSKLFLSHDIDAVYSGWKEDGFSDLKRKKVSTLLKLSFKALTGRPNWLNFEFISTIENRYQYKSTFFWLNYSNNIKGIGKNADYKLAENRIKKEVANLSSNGHQHGLHKSINDLTMRQEVLDFPLNIKSNRYHYLKFTFANLINEMNDSSLEMDASLGYAEVIGFRNGYSLPFKPYDLERKCTANFIEVPLVIMDATLSRYNKLNKEQACNLIQCFIDDNGTNSVISILWHNSHFSNIKYKDYADVYDSSLEYAHRKKMISVQPDYLIETYLK